MLTLLQPLADAYGLLMHRNGQWEWTLAPGVSPSPRYQHAAVSSEICACVYIYIYIYQFASYNIYMSVCVSIHVQILKCVTSAYFWIYSP